LIDRLEVQDNRDKPYRLEFYANRGMFYKKLFKNLWLATILLDFLEIFQHEQTVYGYFRSWSEDGTRLKLYDKLYQWTRVTGGRDSSPSEAAVECTSLSFYKRTQSRLQIIQLSQI